MSNSRRGSKSKSISRNLIIPLGLIIVISMILFLIIFFTVDAKVQTELLKEAAKTILQLMLVGILGTFAKFLFNQYAADKKRNMEELERDRQENMEKLERERTLRTATHKAQLEALNSLTTSYWEIKKAFHIIGAHRSAKSYGEQIRHIIDYRLKLQRLNNEIIAGLYKFDHKDVETIKENLTEMDTRLDEVVNEWKLEYLRLSQLQKQDEKTEEPERKQVPREIDTLPVLNKIKGDDGKFAAIHGPFAEAVTPIRDQIAKSMEGLPHT